MLGLNLDAQLDAGVSGVIIGGSLGEASTLTLDAEKERLVRYAVEKLDNRIPVLLLNIAEGSTREAVAQTRLSGVMGRSRGLMRFCRRCGTKAIIARP